MITAEFDQLRRDATEHAVWAAAQGQTALELIEAVGGDWAGPGLPDWHDGVIAILRAWVRLKQRRLAA